MRKLGSGRQVQRELLDQVAAIVPGGGRVLVVCEDDHSLRRLVDRWLASARVVTRAVVIAPPRGIASPYFAPTATGPDELTRLVESEDFGTSTERVVVYARVDSIDVVWSATARGLGPFDLVVLAAASDQMQAPRSMVVDGELLRSVLLVESSSWLIAPHPDVAGRR